MKVNERYSNLTTSHNKEGETHMNYYTKQLCHAQTGTKKEYVSHKPKTQKTAMTQDQKNEYEYKKRLAKLANHEYMGYQKYDKAAATREAESASQKAWNNYNKEWKKEYNAQYYQKNKDYWKKRYQESLKKASPYLQVLSNTSAWMNLLPSAIARYGSNTLNEMVGKLGDGDINNQSKLVSEGNKAIADALVSLNNYKRADMEQKQLNQFIADNTKKTKVTELWKAGASDVVKAGKSFLDTWKSGLKSIFS